MGFPSEEYWNGWPFLSPGDLPNPGIQPRSALQVVSCIADGSFTRSAPGSPQSTLIWTIPVYLHFSFPWYFLKSLKNEEQLFHKKSFLVWICLMFPCDYIEGMHFQQHISILTTAFSVSFFLFVLIPLFAAFLNHFGLDAPLLFIFKKIFIEV